MTLIRFESGFDPIGWLIPHHRDSYELYAAGRKAHSPNLPYASDLTRGLWVAMALVLLRLIFNWILTPVLLQATEDGKKGNRLTLAKKIEEEIWVILGGAVLLARSMYVTSTRNAGCSLLQSGCLKNWPMIYIDPAVKMYYNVELGWYLHLLLKRFVGHGVKDSRDMMVHHCATLTLICTSYVLNLTQMGLLLTAVFNASNPILHVSKIANLLDWKLARKVSFIMFAVVFSVTRVIVLPLVLCRFMLVDAVKNVPYMWEDYWPVYIAMVCMLAALYVMQLQWAVGIVRVLQKAAAGGMSEAGEEAKRLDPLYHRGHPETDGSPSASSLQKNGSPKKAR